MARILYVKLSMSEMLGNQYFLARKYLQAAAIFEKALQKDPYNKEMRCKIIVCYTQIGEIKKAWNVFVSLVEEDIDFISRMDPIHDDCPCPELVADLEENLSIQRDTPEYYLTLGMLWLYCDVLKSIQYFEKVQHLGYKDPRIKRVISLLSLYLKKQNV